MKSIFQPSSEKNAVKIFAVSPRIAIFAAERANHSLPPIRFMAKSRVSINPLLKGGAGGYTYYVRSGEQVVRQRKNNSNYGEEARRSRAQMVRRILWGNLVNNFKAMKSWQPSAYDNKSQGQTDYNIFMALNINQSTCGCSKEMCQSGCAIVEAFQVSRGGLPPITNSVDNTNLHYLTDINLSITVSGSTTIGALAADIIANNPQFVAGDNIAFVFFRNWQEPRVEWPYAASVYTELTLDPTNTQALSTITNLGSRISKSTGNTLQLSWTDAAATSPLHEVGFVAIHTRRGTGQLQVSSQQIILNSSNLVSQYSGNDYMEMCIYSYGLDEDVPLDPSFRPGTITNVTANSVAISDGDTLDGQQTIRVYGENLYSSNFKFIANNVEYAPFEVHEGYLQYSITANASINLQLNGRQYMSFGVSGISFPSTLSGRIYGRQRDSQGRPVASSGLLADGVCLIYPYKYSAEYPSYRLQVSTTEELQTPDFSGVGCSLTDIAWDSEFSLYNMNIIPNEGRTEPIYVLFGSFVIFISNYIP